MADTFLGRALSDVISHLSGQGVPFALAGGWAYSALVEPRATTDIDLLILIEHPSPESIRPMCAALFGSLVVDPRPTVFKGITIWRLVGQRHAQEVVVDLLLAHTDFLRHALSRRCTIELDDLPVPILTVEDLIVLKVLANRLQDQADLEKIRTRGADLPVDWDHVDEWKRRLGIRSGS